MLKKKKNQLFSYHITTVVGYLSPNTGYIHYDLEITVTVGPAVRLSLIVNEKNIYSYSIKNVFIFVVAP